MKYSTLLTKFINACYHELRQNKKAIEELQIQVTQTPPGGSFLIEQEIRALGRRQKWLRIQITDTKKRRAQARRSEAYWGEGVLQDD